MPKPMQEREFVENFYVKVGNAFMGPFSTYEEATEKGKTYITLNPRFKGFQIAKKIELV